MSDTVTAIYIGADPEGDDSEATDFTTSQWHEALGDAATDEYRALRTRARRFIIVPLIFLAAHAILASNNLPVWLVAVAMLFVIFPLGYFWQLMKDVAEANTAAGMIDRFDLYAYTDTDKLISLPVDTFKKVLGKHFASKDLKKKQRSDAAEKFLRAYTGKQKFMMWAAVIAHVTAMVVVSGVFYALVFALTYVLAFIATVKYFHKATRPLRVLSGYAPKSDTASAADDTDDKKSKKAKKKVAETPTGDTADEKYGPSDEDLLQMVTAYHNGTGQPQDNQFLKLLFGTAVPTVKEFKKMITETPDTKSTSDTAPAADGTTSGLAPLPRRRPRRDDTTQTGSTGTPPHGFPAVPGNAVLSAPVPTPTPAAATPDPKEVNRLLDMYYAGEVLTPDQMKLIEPILYTEEG